MFYTKEDMISLSGREHGAALTPFELSTCKALAFGDNLALCVAFRTLADQMEQIDKTLSEAKENNNLPEGTMIEDTEGIATDSSMLAVSLLTAMAPVIIEV